MAKKASAEAVKADDNGPDYDSALGCIQKMLEVEEKSKKARGPLKGLYDEIDNFRVDRDAARQMKALLKMQPDNRTIMLRGYFGLLIAAKDMLDLPGDMVDMMHKAIPEHLHVETPGQVVPKATGTGKKDVPEEDAQEAGEDDGEGADGADEEQEEILADDTGNPAADDEFDQADPSRLAQVPDVLDHPAGTA